MKKLKIKIIIATLMMTTMVVGLLSGCTSNNTTGAAQNGPVKIEFWYGLGGKLGDNVQAIIKQFNASQKEVVVKGVAQGSYDETYQALQAAIAAKKAPAVVLLDDEQMSELANKHELAPLDEYISKDSSFNASDFVPAFYNEGKIKGKQYALPMYGTTQVLYYRKDMFQNAGISQDSLNTWEGLFAAADKLATKNGGTTSVYGWEPMYGADNLIDAAYSDGGSILSKDGKKVTIDTPEWVNTWDMFRKAIFDSKTMRIHSGGQGWQYWYDTIDDVMKGKAAGYTGSSGDQGDLDFSKIAAHVQPGFSNHKAAPIASAQTMSIPAITNKAEQEAAFKWMEYFTSAKTTAEWSMKTGYIAVRKSATSDPTFKAYAAKNPQILVPLKQASTASAPFVDPTGGKITDALTKAADKVEIENIPAAVALKEAEDQAQQALDSTSK